MSRNVLVVSIVLLLTGFICGEYGSGTPKLKADCSGQSFHLLGEITSLWVAEVRPNTNYEVIVSGGDVIIHPIHWVSISVSDDKGNFIQPKTEYSGYLNFVSPESREIYIWVSSKIGEGHEDYGVFEVKLCEDT